MTAWRLISLKKLRIRLRHSRHRYPHRQECCHYHHHHLHRQEYYHHHHQDLPHLEFHHCQSHPPSLSSSL